jgi:hypothetical protein
MLSKHQALVNVCEFFISGIKVIGNLSEEILVVVGLVIPADYGM